MKPSSSPRIKAAPKVSCFEQLRTALLALLALTSVTVATPSCDSDRFHDPCGWRDDHDDDDWDKDQDGWDRCRREQWEPEKCITPLITDLVLDSCPNQNFACVYPHVDGNVSVTCDTSCRPNPEVCGAVFDCRGEVDNIHIEVFACPSIRAYLMPAPTVEGMIGDAGKEGDI